jgi:hypothetical protein
MGSVFSWVCPSCGAQVSLDFRTCPHCGRSSPSAPLPNPPPTTTPKRDRVLWAQAISVPTAIIGILGFFLPWFQVSCGPVGIQFSGYELATGEWREKMQGDHLDEFWDDFRQGINKGPERRGGLPRGGQRKKSPAEVAQPEAHIGSPVAGLWIVPLACAGLLLLAFFGPPKVPTLLTSAAGSAYLAYFAIDTSRAATDPRNTGGLLQYSWLLGFWMAWLGLVAPAIVALARPSRR